MRSTILNFFNKLNGWQRLWVVFSVIIAIPYVPLIFSVLTFKPDIYFALILFITWLAMIISIYLLGMAINWVRKGFLK